MTITQHGRARLRLNVWTAVVALALTTIPAYAAVKVRVEFDKTFDFKQPRTWGWGDPKEPGQVRMARTPDDDAESMKRRAEPLILKAVSAAMPKRGLTAATANPDVTIQYFLLLTVGSFSQEMGQFLPAFTEWAIPPFSSSTTALQVMEQGSLVLDIRSQGKLVWRGLGEAQIKPDMPQNKRESLINEAVQKILDKYPKK